jgi:hypothetical protein
MRVSLARSGIAWQHALLGVLLVVALSACYVYERPGPGYYGAAVAVAPPPPQVESRFPGPAMSGSQGPGFGTGIGMSGPEVAGWLNARGITGRLHIG